MNSAARARHKRQWRAKVVGAILRTADRAKRGLGPTGTDEAIFSEDRKAADLSPCVLLERAPDPPKPNATRRNTPGRPTSAGVTSPRRRKADNRKGPELDLERVKGIEPSYSAWKAAALPLSYTRAKASTS